MIYLIKCEETKSCKIGYSNNPKRRLSQLQTSSPYSLELVSTIDGGLSDEKLLHDKFKHLNKSGEWFSLDDTILEAFKGGMVESFFSAKYSILDIFMTLTQAEIRLYGYCLKYINGTKFDLSKSKRIEISKTVSLNERTTAETIPSLLEKGLLLRSADGLYQINPFYVSKTNP